MNNINENEFFRQATLRICSSLNIDISLGRCFEYLQKFMPAAGLLLGLYDDDKNVLRNISHAGSGDLKIASVIPMPDELWGKIRKEWTKEPETAIFNDLDLEEDHIRKILTLFLPMDTSFLIMDLELDEKRIGGVMLYAEGKNRFQKEHSRLVSMLHEPFAIALSNILKHQEVLELKELLADDNQYLHRQLRKISGDRIVGSEFGLKHVMDMVRQVAAMDSPVLLLGETGSGKEVVANALHASSRQRHGPFIKINCGAIPEGLLDSELFGHEKGAFTGAVTRKRGRFERAHNGTMFLDEIGELPLPAQVRLLRVLQNHEIERVGGSATISVNVRIISATHRDLSKMVQQGEFREDLWFRLNVFPLEIPSLRERKEDIPALVHHFIERKAKELKLNFVPGLAFGAIERLKSYHWPGNVREVENAVERAIIQSAASKTKMLEFMDLSASQTRGSSETCETNGISETHEKNLLYSQENCLTMDQAVAEHIEKALKISHGKIEGERGAAELLGLHPSTLRGRMRKLGIVFGRKTN
ncbi:MAG: sigma 54-interacting transcriptional regulator [Thermodesulfobacteriota bacterium]|nr:sigma 54-interacting transcriptional regulator [Thermodesulfobacteriota bacterium]